MSHAGMTAGTAPETSPRWRSPLLPKAHLAFNLACGLLLVATVFVLGPHLINSDSASGLLLARDLARTGGWIDPDWAYVSDSLMLDGRLPVAMLGAWLLHDPVSIFVFTAMVGAAFAFLGCYLLSRVLGASCAYAVTAGLVLLLGPAMLYLNTVVGLAVSIQIGLVLCFVAALTRFLFDRASLLALNCALAILLVVAISSPMKAIAYLVIPTVATCMVMLAGARAGAPLDADCRRRMMLVLVTTVLLATVGFALHRLLVMDLYVDTSYATVELALSPAHLWDNVRLVLELLGRFAGSQNRFVRRLSVTVASAATLVAILAPVVGVRWRTLLASRQGFAWIFAIVGGAVIGAYLITYESIKPYYGVYYLLVPAAPLFPLAAWSATSVPLRIVVRAALFLTLACSAANATYLVTVPGLRYSSMSIKQRTGHRDHVAAVKWLRSRGITRGFATYWEANTLTFLSNGDIRATPVRTPLGGRMVRRMAWLGRERWFILLPVRQRLVKLPPTCLPAALEARVADSRIYVYDRPMPGCLQAPVPFGPRKRRVSP
jgi:hypothetical protein